MIRITVYEDSYKGSVHGPFDSEGPIEINFEPYTAYSDYTEEPATVAIHAPPHYIQSFSSNCKIKIEELKR